MAEQSDAPLRGSGFNTDPQTGDWDELKYDNHSLIERVRGENTDTDDAFAIYVQGVSVTTKVFNVLKTGAIWAGSSNTALLGSSPNITLGTAAAGGSSSFGLRQDATIIAYDSTNPSPVGSVASPGSSSLAARRDHYHLGVTSIAASGNAALSGAFRIYAGAGVGLAQIADGVQIMASTAIPAGASSGVPAVILGTTNAAGAVGSFLDSGARIQIYDGTAPASMTVGGAVVQGVGSFAARSNHGHAIANTDINILGGSWGSGPILTNPQVAATGWASANHAHAAANSGGQIAYSSLTGAPAAGTTVVINKAEVAGDQATTSTTYVNITGLLVAANVTASANLCRFEMWNPVINNTGGTTTVFQIMLGASTSIQVAGLFEGDANGLMTSDLLRCTTQLTGSVGIQGMFRTDGGTATIYNSGAPTATSTLIHTEFR